METESKQNETESKQNVTEFTPRAYQIELYEKAVHNNTILYLPTGAGKTYIAVMLLKRLSADVRKAVSNHPMRQIMQRFEDCSKDKHPRVLAMSATLLNANIKLDKIESTIKSLEITFQSKIATVESTNCIQGYCTNPKENIIMFMKYQTSEVIEKIIQLIKISTEVLKNTNLNFDDLYKESSPQMRPKTKSSKLTAVMRDIETTTLQTGIYGGSKSALLHLIQLESLRKYSNDSTTDIVLDYMITQVIMIRKLFDNEMKGYMELEQLHKFKAGSTNCIVATDVVDEGIDVPACTLIIRFDMPMDFRGYVQSKGRARHSSSQYIVLMPKDDVAFLQRYQNYKSIELQLKMSLVGQSELRMLPTDSDISKNLYAYEIKPYVVKHDDNDSCITETSAINLLNMYCSTLMKSKFVRLVPIWKVYKTESHDGTLFQHPMALYSAFPKSLELLHLHVLNCTPTYPMMGYDNRRIIFYKLLNDKSGFGILSTKSIPKVPSFPIFMKDGELGVDVKLNYATMILSESDIELLRRFHFLLFSEIIPVIKSFMVFDNENLENSFLIVPLNDNQEINWDVVRTYQHIERIMPSKPFHFRTSDYELALVTPTYRGSANVYIVTRVCDDLTPESCFPNEDFDTFTHYYKEKHGLTIENLQQSMLEVKPIPIKINYIKPRKLHDGSAKSKKADDTVEDLQEHLIPELCWRINFPSVYWLKATMLPSILHRISQLLIAEDLRVTIARETKLGSLTLEKLSPLTSEKDIMKLIEEEPYNRSDLMMDIDVIEKTQTDLNMYELSDHNSSLNDKEPQDLYRNMEQVQMIDIQYYNNFISTDCNDSVQKNTNQSQIGRHIVRPTVPVPSLDILVSSEKLFNSHGPNIIEIMHALTTKLGTDMFDLERLETLGDSYLKFITSIFLYHKFPTFNEGQLTAVKGKIIGNRNLYYCGKKKNIPGRIKNDAFIPTSNFIAPAFTVFRQLQKILLDESVAPNILYELRIPEEEKYTGHISENTKNIMQQTVIDWDKEDTQTGYEHYLGVQILSDKTIADSVEALIGVYLRSNGIRGAAKLLKWFGILPEVEIDELLYSNPLDPIIGSGDLNKYMPWADAMEIKIGYKFNNRAFLLQAFTHPSYSANGITECYQRLEFLGDAILDFLITCYIYESCGNLSPGDLTDLRSALVNNITFACLAVRYGLDTALLAYAPKLHEAIDRFVKFQQERNYAVNDELLWILLEEEECNLAEYVDVPKVLGDLFESLIGAIYLDTGKNLTKVWEIVYCFIHKEIDKFSRNIPKHPVRLIHENTDARPKFMDAELLEGADTIMVPLKIIIAGKEKLFHGFGANKKQAKCAAAKQALKRLQLEI
ncbi:endoribonuclease dicer [Lasius niger]|uniref:Endoribonuclease dicer n=1 Tax=Lasius niger TaxID=67767 RepID=A0A0J7L2K8_LASNI|nr:endoribonuclease dicer [Lasius niger]